MNHKRVCSLVYTMSMAAKAHYTKPCRNRLNCSLVTLCLLLMMVLVQLLLFSTSLPWRSNQLALRPHPQLHQGRSLNWGLERNLLDHEFYDTGTEIFSELVDKYSGPEHAALWEYHGRGLALRKKFNCMKLFESDVAEQAKVFNYVNASQNTFNVTSSEKAIKIVSDCQAFKAVRGYRTSPGNSEERDFPLAYNLVVHKDFEHLERLLRMLYMPQHSFCIHVDAKSPDALKKAVAGLASCFDNVILASQPQKVVYAHMSRLMADIVCMRDLVAKDKSWKYLINFAATEFPLRSNLELVKILQILHGLNDIHEQYHRRVQDRFNREHIVVNGSMKHTHVPLPPPPHNLTIIKGQAYNTFSRAFLEWAFTDKIAVEFLNWSNKTYSPDEHYWATLNDLYHNPFLKAPGGFQGHPDRKGYITRFISWQYDNPTYICRGRVIHHICVFSALDLHLFADELHLAANKFDLTFDPVAYSCMEELYENKTRASLPFNLRHYRKLYFVNFRPPSR